jgi:hypothetical protein
VGLWLIAKKLQGLLVRCSRLVKLVFDFLCVAQIVGRQAGGEDIAARLAKPDGFQIGLTGGGAVSLQQVSKPQSPVRGRARRQVARV